MAGRLDAYLSAALGLSRKQAAALVRSGAVAVNGAIVRDSGLKLAAGAAVFANGLTVGEKSAHIYIMLNKPSGVVSASKDVRQKTVVDLVAAHYGRSKLFPAGRLDKTTTGFMIITDDGVFAHKLLAPKNHVKKVYNVLLSAPVTAGVAAAFEAGVVLADGRRMKAAQLVIDKQDARRCTVTLRQGVYHQIKRMFGVYGLGVDALHRAGIGALTLDEALAPGEHRLLSTQEVALALEAAE